MKILITNELKDVVGIIDSPMAIPRIMEGVNFIGILGHSISGTVLTVVYDYPNATVGIMIRVA